MGKTYNFQGASLITLITERYLIWSPKMKRQPSGFTLVELLVVITIIGILMGLLIPAVNAARETARKNQCATNMKNLALAGVQHEVTKKALPGYIQSFGKFESGLDPSDPTNTPQPHLKLGTWAVALLPWLDGQPTYEHWTQDRYPVTTSSDALGKLNGASGNGMHPLAAPNIAIFQCPSNPVARGNFGKNSMVYNNGMHWKTQDGTNLLRNQGGVTALMHSMDKNSGVGTQQFNSTADAVTLDDMKDGQGFTMMFSENVQALPWHRSGLANKTRLTLANVNPNDAQVVNQVVYQSRYTNGMVWHYEDDQHANTTLEGYWNGSPKFNQNLVNGQGKVQPEPVLDFHKINGRGATVSDDIFNLELTGGNSNRLARPSSAHVDGVNCAFADGATRFVVQSIDYRVLQALMTPRGKASLVPYPEFVLTDELGD